MPLTLYFALGSPPARGVLQLARILNLDIEIKVVDLVGGEQRTEEYQKINPVGKVPVLVDGDFVLSESRAILGYLVNSRKPGSELYPSEPKARALVDQRLYYDATVVFERLADVVRPGLYYKLKTLPQKARDDVRAALKTLDGFLEGQEYFAGKSMTIADISILGSVASFDEMGYDVSQYSNLGAWYKRMQTIPKFEDNLKGAKLLGDLVRDLYPGETPY